jgi:hypothetical protein
VEAIVHLLEVLNKFDTGSWIMLMLASILIIGGVCFILYLLVRVLKTIKIGFGKDGVKLESSVLNTIEETQKKLYEDHQRLLEEQNRILSDAGSNQHWMDEDNKVNDEHLKQRCMERTNALRLRLRNALAGVIDNSIMIAAVCVHIRATFGNAIVRNHFTKELMPNRITAYYDRIWSEVKEEYVGLQRIDSNAPPIENVEKILMQFVKDWLEMLKKETITTCEEKIQTYSQYRPRFEKVPHILAIVDSRIEKNKNYIAELK